MTLNYKKSKFKISGGFEKSKDAVIDESQSEKIESVKFGGKTSPIDNDVGS